LFAALAEGWALLWAIDSSEPDDDGLRRLRGLRFATNSERVAEMAPDRAVSKF
jgi:hypothetical protein